MKSAVGPASGNHRIATPSQPLRALRIDPGLFIFLRVAAKIVYPLWAETVFENFVGLLVFIVKVPAFRSPLEVWFPFVKDSGNGIVFRSELLLRKMD